MLERIWWRASGAASKGRTKRCTIRQANRRRLPLRRLICQGCLASSVELRGANRVDDVLAGAWGAQMGGRGYQHVASCCTRICIHCRGGRCQVELALAAIQKGSSSASNREESEPARVSARASHALLPQTPRSQGAVV